MCLLFFVALLEDNRIFPGIALDVSWHFYVQKLLLGHQLLRFYLFILFVCSCDNLNVNIKCQISSSCF